MANRTGVLDKPDYVYGRHAALEALRGPRGVKRLLLAASVHRSGVADLLALAEQRGVPVATVDRRRLDDLAAGHNHQGVLAEALPFAYSALEQLVDVATTAGAAPLLLALDSLQDPQNFGTLLRTALASGAHGVLIPEHRAVGVTPAVARASAGAVEHLPVARVTNLVRALQWLKECGVWTYGLAAGVGQPFWQIDWQAPSLVVVGSEGHGVGRLVRGTCDAMVQVPMAAGALESLNAAVAGSLVLYEAFRQRSGGTSGQPTATGTPGRDSLSTT